MIEVMSLEEVCDGILSFKFNLDYKFNTYEVTCKLVNASYLTVVSTVNGNVAK